MLRRWAGRACGWLLAAAAVSACAPSLVYQGRGGYGDHDLDQTPHGLPPSNLQPPSEPRVAGATALADLPGWGEDDHVTALIAFQRACRVDPDPAMQRPCARGQALGDVDEYAARTFFETNFRAERLATEGVLTGYFAPNYPARLQPDPDFSTAVRARPSDLSLTPASEDPAGRRTVRQVGEGGESWAYPDRAGIELTPPAQALAWMRPEDLFFMQVQGSGVLDLPDGRRMRAVYAGDNGRPFVPIASAMVRRGLLAPSGASATAIRTWLRTHRAEAQAVMDINPRYVFFSLQVDDGLEPAGAAGVRLTAGRSIAVDPVWHTYGELCWIDGVAPLLAGAPRSYRRLVMALDTGSAIKGVVRADLYTGGGDAAGVEAGRIRHVLHMFKLVPLPATADVP